MSLAPLTKRIATESAGEQDRPILITGGAGFIGTNLADRLAAAGHSVLIYDNLSREGVDRNLAYLRSAYGERVSVVIGDVRDAASLRSAVRRASQVFHLAAQVAVTTSLVDPEEDFAVNAQGTVNLLEAARRLMQPPPLVFTSTNKVYGAIDDLPLKDSAKRYIPLKKRPFGRGISESQPLDFRSPYGCSKGAADQYVLDYARSYGLSAVVFRMSCIYGPHQCGTEDQGWVAHFILQALAGEAITIYGDGRQVRDILYVEDLVNAFLLAQQHMAKITGQAFNIGGGAGNAISLLELVAKIAELRGAPLDIRFGAWRTGDQRYYVSDHEKFTATTGWRPSISAADGVERLYLWLRDYSATAQRVPSVAATITELPDRKSRPAQAPQRARVST